MPDRARSRKFQVFLALWLPSLILLAAWIRVEGTDAYYYSPDEAMHVNIASGRTLGDVWRFSRFETHPPLFYFFCHYWRLLGSAPDVMRRMPLLFGLLLIPLYYHIGKKLGGEAAGIACALLVAFSQGGIAQSCLMRHYIPMLLFLSLSFCFYLRWREKKDELSLYGYGVFAALGCLTHFSGVFFVACIAAYEAIGLFLHHREAFRRWILLHCLIPLPVLALLPFLYPTFVFYRRFFHEAMDFGLMPPTPFYAFECLAYLFPPYYAILPFALPLLPHVTLRSQTIRFLLTLAGMALCLSLVLDNAGIYPPQIGFRHGFWMFPFAVPALAVLLAEAYGAAPRIRRIPLPVAALFLALAGYVTYSPKARFSDGFEYVVKRSEWRELQSRLSALGPQDVIVTSTTDAQLLENAYPYMEKEDPLLSPMPVSIPFGRSHLLFNPYYPRYISPGTLTDTLNSADRAHMLPENGNIVLFKTSWLAPPLTQLMECTMLEKSVLMNTPAAFYGAPGLALTSVPLQAYRRDVLPPAGKAYRCMFNDK